MERIELAPAVFHLRSGSNMGLVLRDGKGLLIDTGLDKDAGRQALRAAEALDVTLEAVFITHAHADHFGGAHFLQRRLGLPLYAPALEAVRERVYATLKEPQETSALVQQVANHFELRLTTTTAYFLTRTTILAALSSLERAGDVVAVMEGNRLEWQRR